MLKPVSVQAETQGNFCGHAGLNTGASGGMDGKCQPCVCQCVVNTGPVLCQLPRVRMSVFVVMSLVEAVVAEAPWGL